MSDSKPVAIFHPSRKKWILVLLSSLPFVGIGIWIVATSGGFTELLLGYFSIVFFGASALTCIAVLVLPGSSFLMIRPEGIVIRTLWYTKFYRWEEIESFGVDEISARHKGMRISQKFVGITYSSVYTAREKTIFSRINDRFGKEVSKGNFDDTLPDSYGEDPEELAKRLTNWRKQFIAA